MRFPLQPKPAKVVSGPDRDPLLNASISVSLRRAGCDAYLLAVNSACSNVTADVDIFDANVGEAEVMWENRRAKVSGGTIREDFAPFAVHVYHWRTRTSSASPTQLESLGNGFVRRISPRDLL